MQNFNSFIINANEKINPAFKIPPPEKAARTIVFSTDNNYSKYFAAALQSLIENSEQNINYDIIVFETEISDYNKKLLLNMLPPNFSLRFFKTDDFIRNKINPNLLMTNTRRNWKDNWSTAAWYRCFIPFLMPDYEKVLYCDSDIIFNNSIEELFNIDFEGKEILAVKDSFAFTYKLTKNPIRKKLLEENMNLKDVNSYFNSGIIMFNIPQFNTKEYYNSFCNSLFKHKNLPFHVCHDQDVLNPVFDEKKKLISFRYNFPYHTLIHFRKQLDIYPEDYHKARENPVIIHYTDRIKPWQNPTNEFCAEWWQYARKTPFYEDILYSNIKNDTENSQELKFYGSFFEYIFSIKNAWDNKHKVLTILGIKIKIKKKNKK